MFANYSKRLSLFILLVVLPVNFTQVAQAAEEGRIGVMTTIAPISEFIEQIGGERVQVTVMVPLSANEHTYEPTPSQLKELSRAKLYIAAGSGIEFELVWLERFEKLNPLIQIVNVSKNIARLPSGEHDPDDAHQDPHVWLSVENAKIMVRQIADALIQADGAYQEFYKRNSDSYLIQLENLHQEIKERLLNRRTKDFISAHSAWRYFAQSYSLNEIAIESEGKEPGASQILDIIKTAKQEQIKVVFTAPQFSKRHAEMIAKEINGRLIEADPLNKNYIKNLRQFSNDLAESLS